MRWPYMRPWIWFSWFVFTLSATVTGAATVTVAQSTVQPGLSGGHRHCPDAMALTSALQRQLQESGLASVRIEVRTNCHVVIAGQVKSQMEWARAFHIASHPHALAVHADGLVIRPEKTARANSSQAKGTRKTADTPSPPALSPWQRDTVKKLRSLHQILEAAQSCGEGTFTDKRGIAADIRQTLGSWLAHVHINVRDDCHVVVTGRVRNQAEWDKVFQAAHHPWVTRVHADGLVISNE